MATGILDPEAAFAALARGDGSVDRYRLFDRLREELPVFHSEAVDAWVLTRYEDVFAVLEDEERFWTLTEGRGAPVYGRTLLQWRGREHNKKAGPVLRRIRSPRAFSEGLDEVVREVTTEVADRLPMGEPVDFKSTYAMWMPLLVITRLLDIDEGTRFRDWYHAIAQGGVSSIARPGLRDAAFTALSQLRALLEPIVAQRREHPGADVVSDLATARYDGEPLAIDEIVATVAFLLTAGVETTERALTSLFRHLALNPDTWEQVRARRADRTFLLSLSAETLRCFSPVQGLTRAAHVDVTVGDVALDAGDRVLVSLSSANRDPRVFDDPERFDSERWLDNAERQFVAGGRVLPFGAGRHHCAGSPLAATEMVHAIREFCDRVEWLEPAGDLPVAEGLLLNSPPSLPVILHPA
jgi:pulcherriminic acid synthase